MTKPRWSAISPRPFRNELLCGSEECVLLFGKEVINFETDEAVVDDLPFDIRRLLPWRDNHQPSRMLVVLHLCSKMTIRGVNIECPCWKREEQPTRRATIWHPLRDPFVIDRSGDDIRASRRKRRRWRSQIGHSPHMRVRIERIGRHEVLEVSIPQIKVVVADRRPDVRIDFGVGCHSILL